MTLYISPIRVIAIDKSMSIILFRRNVLFYKNFSFWQKGKFMLLTIAVYHALLMYRQSIVYRLLRIKT